MGTLIGSTFRNALALRLNGTTQYAQDTSVTWRSDTVGSLRFRVRFTTVPVSTSFKAICSIVSTVGGNNSVFYIGIRWNSLAGSQPRICIGNSNAAGTFFTDAVGSTNLSAGVWYDVVVTSSAQIYINGVAETVNIWLTTNGPTPGWFGNLVAATYAVQFGIRGSGFFLDGDLDEILYFNTVQTGAQALALYNGGTPINPWQLGFGAEWKTWLRCGDSRDDATTMYDERGTDNFTLVGSPPYVAP